MTMQVNGLSGSTTPGQNATINGSGFGVTRDADAYVLLWPSDDETPKTVTVVSWNNTTIVVTIPANTLQNIPGAFFTVVRPTVEGPRGARSPLFTTGVLAALYNNNWVGQTVEAKNPYLVPVSRYAHVPMAVTAFDNGATVDVVWLEGAYVPGVAKTALRLLGTLTHNYLNQTLQAPV